MSKIAAHFRLLGPKIPDQMRLHVIRKILDHANTFTLGQWGSSDVIMPHAKDP